jgi:hypothetical protein
MAVPFQENPPEDKNPQRTRKPYSYPTLVKYVERETEALGLKMTDTIEAFVQAMKDAWFDEQK